ncbi:MAG: MBL fold metallo-hydrolase [Clostridia bacterium]|nr:MBL fold metallo-hydrolase [Clostridia bacterium]
MSETALYLQTETSAFMMSIILKTAAGNAVVIDGGRPEDMPLLRELVGNAPIKAWILTHPHLDHITGLTGLIRCGNTELWPEKIYYNFPTLSFLEETEPSEAWTLREFLEIEDRIADRAVILRENDRFSVDELDFTVLQSWEEKSPIVPARPGDENSTGNENSLVFRVDTPGKGVLILGDAGPLAGDRLMSRHWQDLKADIVQMAHHGHGGVGAEVYLAASPEACLWCCADWLYNEAPYYLSERLWGTVMTRNWMAWMGVTKHYVTGEGTHKIILHGGTTI